MRVTMSAIYHNHSGFQALIRLYEETRECLFEDIDIDMAPTNWFDADMCACFGAILYQLGDNLNTVRLVNIHGSVETILSKNGFLSSYGRARIPDTWGTTIPYQRFDIKDGRYFAQYIETEFIHRPEMPAISRSLGKKICESLFEIFNNSVLHSQTELGIFSCGQYYPKRHRLNFSIVDLGIGIRRNIKEKLELDMAADEAISWAMENRNTTKRGPIPGGLGLKLLKEFISLNGGVIQIVSDAGYWHMEGGYTDTALFSQPFPGTVVNIEINTSDAQSYQLSNEIAVSDIF